MSDADDCRPQRDLLDQSKLRAKRAKRRVAESNERVARTHHEWHKIAVGRICFVCRLAQADGQFDDGAPCKESAS